MIVSRCRTLLNLSLLLFVIWIPPAGAQPALVKDINLLPQGFSLLKFVAIGNVVYFVTSTSVHGEELWCSNGTAAGTVLAKDIWPGSGGSYPSSLTNVNGVLYLRRGYSTESTFF